MLILSANQISLSLTVFEQQSVFQFLAKLPQSYISLFLGPLGKWCDRPSET